MVEVMTIERTGGAYTDSVFGAQTNPSVTIKLISWQWQFDNKQTAIDIPETTGSTAPVTMGGGFKRITIGIQINGYLDSTPTGEGTVETKKKKLWNIVEFGKGANTFVTFRGVALFGLVPGVNTGQCMITSLRMDEDAIISEPAQSISGSVSEPKRMKVSFTIRKVLDSQ